MRSGAASVTALMQMNPAWVILRNAGWVVNGDGENYGIDWGAHAINLT